MSRPEPCACRLSNESYIELPCNKVSAAVAARLNLDLQGVITAFNQRAAAWWQSVLDEPHSFSKPVYQLGLSGVEASNVEAAGAISLVGSSVSVLGPLINMAAAKVGDGFCCRVNVSDLSVHCLQQGRWTVPGHVVHAA
jgi:hypothetical protein